MPTHTSWLTYLIYQAEEFLNAHSHWIGKSFYEGHEATYRTFEPLIAAVLIALFLVLLGFVVRGKLRRTETAIEPEAKLTLMTAVEVFLSYFYDVAKSVMGPERAKKYYLFIGTSACFVFLSNIIALVPGFPVPTSDLSITAGCALVIFLAFNIYGIKRNGFAYIKHLGGPAWYMFPLIFMIEVVSLSVRPVTLAVRLMLNMSVDHLLLGIFVGFASVLLPLPVMLLGCIVILVQTLVFTLLATIYISLATEDLHAH